MSLQRSFPFFYLKGLFKLTKEDYGQGGLVYKDMAVLSKNKKLLWNYHYSIVTLALFVSPTGLSNLLIFIMYVV